MLLKGIEVPYPVFASSSPCKKLSLEGRKQSFHASVEYFSEFFFKKKAIFVTFKQDYTIDF